MAESIIDGYLINKFLFKGFDEIVTFIDKKGIRYSCISLGSKKIESKNARNLFLGSYIEFQIFKSRFENKLSKLKKATLLKETDWKIESDKSFIVLTNCISRVKYTSKEFFDFYKTSIDFISSHEYNSEATTAIILYRFVSLNGLNENNDNIECSDDIKKNIDILHQQNYSKLNGSLATTIKCLKNFILKVLEIHV
ncbi:MAG: hypothetical protein Ta2E_04960 [Mycoplasmoidaceae bacterium]|nr:MAG: hypothetical protein Ta2E_04960 [Mycoplasmoidaceae bacterium]